MRIRLVAALLAAASLGRAEKPAGPTKITFPSKDGLAITADLYVAHEAPETPFIVLFHQAGSSRGEYGEIAPRLNKLGFNCLAVDQRSGKGVLDVTNETAARAKEEGKQAGYLDARQDMVAALEYARATCAKGKLIAWGSSYSAALALQIVGSEPALADGVISFSPGEYFESEDKPDTWIRDSVGELTAPVLIASATREKKMWEAIYEAIPEGKKSFYLPEQGGRHGSSALWSRFEFSAGYWKAVETFLKEHFAEPQAPEEAASD